MRWSSRRAQHPGGDEPERDADRGRHERGDRHPDDELDRRDVPPERLDGDREDDDAGAVVEEALGLDERRQPSRRAEAREDGDDGRWIGRRKHRPDEERQGEGEPRRDVEHQRHRRGRDEDAHRRENRDRRQVRHQVAKVDPVGGLEDQPRNEDRQEDVRRDLEIQRRLERRDREAQEDEPDAVGQDRPPGDDRHDRRRGNQHDEDLQDRKRFAAGHWRQSLGHRDRPV